nr:retrovirus-related Pol polyprotein from transposon TNT 1-94 [Tanacetum cinerariifolium]
MFDTPRRNDVYVLNMSSLTPNRACFFAKASESINWLWHKRLSHLNFETIKLAKQNKVFGLPSLVYSKDKPCSACEKGKHERASFKTKQKFSIKKCLHLLHMDLFRQVSQMYINHEKYTLVIVDGYSRYIWVHFLRKKSQAAEMSMSFIRMVENQNNVKVKQIRTNNGVEFRNSEFESFCDEKGISPNFSSPYTPEQNGVAERKNTTLIEATRTMLNGLDKKDELGTVIRNKARLVTQGFSQVEGIDYDETFAPVTRKEAIRIFLAYATYMNFIVFQIDVLCKHPLDEKSTQLANISTKSLEPTFTRLEIELGMINID